MRTIQVNSKELFSIIVSLLLLVVSPFSIVTPFYDFFLLFLIVVLLLSILYSHVESPLYINKKILIVWFLLFTWVLFSFIYNGITTVSFIRVVQFIGCFAAFLFGYSFDFNDKHLQILKVILSIIVILIFVSWLIDRSLKDYSFVFKNPNALASYLLIILPIISFDRSDNKIGYLYLLIIFLLFVTSSRTSLLSAILFLFLIIVFRAKRPSNEILLLFFGLEFLLIISFVFCYSQLVDSKPFQLINDFSLEYLGKPLNSGRDRIWPLIIEIIKNKPVQGYGLSALPQDFLSISLSSHNLYLQTALQIGLPGLLLLILVIAKIFCLCLNNNQTFVPIAFTFSVILHESFEITLTQNYLAFGLIVWFIWGIGCKNKKEASKNE